MAGKLTKSFQYSLWGERLSQVKVNADNTEESSYYGYNPHTDVEQITKENGDTRATYGYTAYGKHDNNWQHSSVEALRGECDARAQ
ncbi:hypothetical protein [Nonomuraea jiangxiensis]|uniref:YD repeat-containing protein n=1 Tax=Nonomuraea jiangxiensis TaxID=633440 RepID=A0A1G8YSJ7_9ACTN|nr:hypothetical protein [Nonomuraea jiangxiensis]SDK05829.1 hypothetical protein SAMN05421869_113367 [Nonomuraea jiangxiensis]